PGGRDVRAVAAAVRERVGVAPGVARRPDLLGLEEPTAGLDPEQRLRVRELLSGLAADRTVVLSTHQTEGVAALGQRVVVLHEGAVRFDGTTRALAELARGQVWLADTREAGARLSWRTG